MRRSTACSVVITTVLAMPAGLTAQGSGSGGGSLAGTAGVERLVDCRAGRIAVRLRRLPLPPRASICRRSRRGSSSTSARTTGTSCSSTARASCGARHAGDLSAWPYETIDLAPWLRAGRERARGRGLELRRRGAAGATHLADGVHAAGRHRGRDRWPTPRRSGSPRSTRAYAADPDLLPVRCEGTGPQAPASTSTATKYPWGWEQPDVRRVQVGAGRRRRRRRDRARHATRTAGTCSCRATSR